MPPKRRIVGKRARTDVEEMTREWRSKHRNDPTERPPVRASHPPPPPVPCSRQARVAPRAPTSTPAISKKPAPSMVQDKGKARVSSPPRRSPSPSSSSSDSREPSSPSEPLTEKAKKFLNRPFTCGRKVDFNFLENEGFEIGNLLKFQGWEFLCSVDLPTYPDLVREFYMNATITPRCFSSKVKGNLIVLTEEKLGFLLHAPNEGSENLPSRELGLRLLFERDDAMHFEEISARDLSMEHRLLHHMTARILLPRVGRFDFVTNKDLTILYHVIRREKMNLPAMILRLMQESVQRVKTALPYGMFLTLVFRDFGVKLEGEPHLLLHHYDTYNAKSLKRMKYRKMEDGTWMKNDDGERGPMPVPRHVRSAAAPASASSAGITDEQIQYIISSVLDGVRSEVSTLIDDAVRRLSTTVEETIRRVLSEQSSSDPAPPAPPPSDV